MTRKSKTTDYEIHDFPEVAEALKDIRDQYLSGQRPLVWRGPDRLHHSIAAGCPEPSALFSEEGLAYDAERDRDFWDTYMMVTFQLGYHNGYLRAWDENDVYRKDFSRLMGD